MRLRRALQLYAGVRIEPMSGVMAQAATSRIQRLLEWHEWGRDELRALIQREIDHRRGERP